MYYWRTLDLQTTSQEVSNIIMHQSMITTHLSLSYKLSNFLRGTYDKEQQIYYSKTAQLSVLHRKFNINFNYLALFRSEFTFFIYGMETSHGKLYNTCITHTMLTLLLKEIPKEKNAYAYLRKKILKREYARRKKSTVATDNQISDLCP